MFFRKKKKNLETPASPPHAPADARRGPSQINPTPDPAALIRKFPAIAEQHANDCRTIFQANLDYSAKSLDEIDRIIEHGWPNGPPKLLDPVVLAFGAYVGETFRRLEGGEWAWHDQFGFSVQKLGGTGTQIFPFAKVTKRFMNGTEDSIGFYYRAVRSVIQNPKAHE
jgi:hypothetical protein